jgi:hypothetical protein
VSGTVILRAAQQRHTGSGGMETVAAAGIVLQMRVQPRGTGHGSTRCGLSGMWKGIRSRRVIRWRCVLIPAGLGVMTTLTVAWILPGVLHGMLHITWRRGTISTGPAAGWAMRWATTVVREMATLEPPGDPYNASLPAAEAPDWLHMPASTAKVDKIICEVAGFPWRAMSCEERSALTAGRGRYESLGIDGGIALSRTSDRFDVVPLRPVWSGLFGDVLVWGGAWWMGIAGVGALRAWRKKSREGKCTTCGYDLHGLAAGAPCPECGTPRVV